MPEFIIILSDSLKLIISKYQLAGSIDINGLDWIKHKLLKPTEVLKFNTDRKNKNKILKILPLFDITTSEQTSIYSEL